ncbi:MAG: TIGR00296 family protein, partial [Candidatus Omnitrophica bacterium]|nr:TIGR00296 family protein [Candidatus Omnitrophota bacterium]
CKVIAQMAIEAATGDPRFKPVTKNELEDIDIEISVLTEPQLINDWRKIRLGIDGVIVEKGFTKGVFLPQVATETGWSLEDFLGELCSQKARLPRDAYKDPQTQIYTFQAYVFSEDK